MPFTREQIRESIERAGDVHWQALIRHHTDAYPESRPTPGDVTRAEAERLNELGLGDNPDLKLVESRVERVDPAATRSRAGGVVLRAALGAALEVHDGVDLEPVERAGMEVTVTRDAQFG